MKSLSLILRIVAIVAGIAATTLFFISKGKLADKEAELTQAKQVIAATQADLEEANKTIVKTESELQTERDMLAKTKQTLGNVRDELGAAQMDLTRANNELTDAKGQITELKSANRDLNANLIQTQKELAEANREGEINQLNERIAQLEKTNSTLERELEAKTVITDAIANKNGGSSSAALGEINNTFTALNTSGAIDLNAFRIETTINSISTSDGLIVLDSTPELGLTAGQTIVLVQNMKSVAKIQIQSVTETYAVANILPGTSSKNLSTGDVVRLLL